MKQKKISNEQLKTDNQYNFSPTKVGHRPPVHWTSFEKRIRPLPDNKIEDLGYELIWYFETNPEAITVFQFCHYKAITEKDYYLLVNRSEFLAKCHDYILGIIAMRREVGAAFNRINDNVLKMMPAYSKSWKEIEEWRASLRDKERHTNEQKIVVIERFPDPPQENKD